MLNNNPKAYHLMWKTVLAIIALTLFPFDIVAPSATLPELLSGFFTRPVEWDDFALNIIFFIPVGILLTLLLPATRHIWLIVAAGAGLSLALEMIQLFIPQRMSAFPDVLSNTAGTMVGIGIGRLWGARAVNAFYTLLSRLRQTPYRLALTVAAVCYFSGWMLYAAHLIRETRLENWDASYNLCVANEMNGQRGWLGSVAEIAFYDLALRESDAVNLTANDQRNGQTVPVATANFSLPDWESNPQGLPQWRPQSAGGIQQTSEGIDLLGGWLMSDAPPAQLLHRLVDQNRFSIFIRFRTADITRSGPVRILTWSKDFYHHNFMLGQHQRGLMFNLNTTVASHSGNSPYILLKDVLRENVWQNLVVVYDGNALSLYLDGEKQAHPLQLSPAAAAFAPLKYFPSYSLPMLKLLFLVIIFVPLGAMTNLALTHRFYSIATVMTAVFAPSVLQTIQVMLADRTFDSSEWAVSVVMVLMGGLFFQFPNLSTEGQRYET